MDITVTPVDHDKAWHLSDLLGRSMGTIEETEPGVFYIRPMNRAIVTMNGMRRGHPSLDEALKAIETHTRGVCRLVGPAKGNER